ncbi:flagellar hook-associated protein FlgK [Fibrobacterota bacterium]
MSIFGSLGIGTRGLAASQLALNVAGQNISNANTEGYSRKRLEMSASTQLDPRYGEMGFGVEIEKVSRYTDIFLETQIRNQMTDSGYYSMLEQALERVENILTEPTDMGLNESIDKFWNAWQDMANNPDNMASREVVKSTAIVLTDKFHTLSSQLEDLRLSKDEDIEGRINEINGITQEIFNLNNEVAVGELRGGEANDSRDKRDMLVRELSKIIDVDVVEDELGAITITTAGNVLVGPATVIPLELQRTTSVDESGMPVSEVVIRFSNTKKDYMPRGGELKGLFNVRDQVIPRYEGVLDEMATSFVNSVNSLHFTGYNLKQNTGVNFFDAEGTTAKTIQVGAAILSDVQNIAAASGGVTQGVQIDGISEPLSVVPPQLSPQLDLKSMDSEYRNIVQGSMQVTRNGAVLQEGAGLDYVVDYQFGTIAFLNYAKYSAGDSLDITFRYNDAGYPGPGDGSNALRIAQIRDQLIMDDDGIGNPTKTIGEFYAGAIGALGVERSQSRTTMETRDFLVDQFEARKLEISGVSLDEELANMIRFEHTYQASARYITVINEILDTLINL